ncbi:serine/threonine protein kinase, negative regulator of sexual conjugation and meiosis [Hygrophoropsis aurantiaca]|uniref:Serine/threonine protein kinase, negative regulator of sexual conjugation and meiosis n=1 Tax=Hygrophoropsis aurantiaca TaxID=72124 RepID=A0ACB8A9X7_9AGAM|nr:serine/threonine protein kinase, negative regulator of sexual conjugation and meiosis [Hygrophoropsis aurantiaca]
MPLKQSASTSSPPPPLGTLIDNDTLELVEVLGVGGYGVVYRAVDTRDPLLHSYAVKCLVSSHMQHGSRQRQLHIREIALHRLASVHPNVVTLHRVVEEFNYTYIIMDYASDGDLFSQILHSCRYLGHDHFIKHIFLQLLDAVEYCHSLGIYHRDLKPENVLCFDGGLRIAITDFGLATTDRFSEEFRTGSVYHMSPECQGGEFAPTGSYSPLFNDIWSLAIILLNLTTGRNPWKSASPSDPTFQAYLQDPANFLPTVLPISAEVNEVLCRMLEVDWRHRITLAEVRAAIQEVDHFYADGVIFEGSMARCAWEIDIDLESDSDSSTKGDPIEPEAQEELKSFWSRDSDSEMEFTKQAVQDPAWEEYSSCNATWGFESSIRAPSASMLEPLKIFETPRTPPSTYSPLSPSGSGSFPSAPVTPEAVSIARSRPPPPLSKPLKIDTGCGRRIFFTDSCASRSTISSTMHTAVESCTQYSSSLFDSPTAVSRLSFTSSSMPSSVDLGVYATPGSQRMDSIWDYSNTDFSTSSYPPTTLDSVTGLDLSLDHHRRKTGECSQPQQPGTWRHDAASPMHSHVPAIVLSTFRPITPPATTAMNEVKPKSSGLFRFSFPRSSSPASSVGSRSRRGSFTDSFRFPSFFSSSPRSSSGSWRRSSSPSSPESPPPPTSALSTTTHEHCRQEACIRPKRHWFSPGKLFMAAGAS